MPFGEEGTSEHRRNLEIFERVIKPAVLKTGIVAPEDCTRVDLVDRPNSIIQGIVEGLHKADIVVADLSGRNPHVFYELGARHILRRGTILITQSRKDVPFHLLTDRVILYSYPMEKAVAEEFEAKIGAQMNAIARNLDEPDSPFSQQIPSVGRTYSRANLILDMPIERKQIVSGDKHIYTIRIVMHNKGYRKIEDLDWEAYWPADIPVVSRNMRMEALKEDPLRRRYIRFRNSAQYGQLGPDKVFDTFFVEFEVNNDVHYSGVLSKPVLLRVYADSEPPIEQEFSLLRPDRKGVDF